MESEKNSLSLGRTLLTCGAPALLLVVLFHFVSTYRRPESPDPAQLTKLQIGSKLDQLLFGLQRHDEVFKHLPDIRDKAGKPLLSWRVAILPFIGEGKLFDRFNLQEPWDSPHNHALLKEMPDLFALPGQNETSETYFQAFAGPGTAFDPSKKPLSLGKDLADKAHDTVLLVIADTSVPWTKPADVPFHPEKPLSITGAALKKIGLEPRIVVGFADGRMRVLPEDFDEWELRRWIHLR